MTKYGLWDNGERKKFFEVSLSKDIDQQLKQFEESLIFEKNTEFSFNPPVKFFEKLALAII
jgi:hypothetical protein